MRYLALIPLNLFILLFSACGEEPIPKPKGELRLEYPTATYRSIQGDCPFDFLMNTSSEISSRNNCSFVISYPQMNANIYLTYKRVDGNMEKLLRDAQKLTYEHVVKADNIAEQPFLNEAHKVYGMFYEVRGNAASQSQFYVTDSIQNFLTGSLYFNSRPNYDSVMPAAMYLEKDIRKIMESLRWK